MGTEVVADTADAGQIRRRPSWWRRGLSLRPLMLGVLSIGAGLGLLINRVANRTRAIATISAAGGHLGYRDLNPKEGGFWVQLYRWTGLEFCREVVQAVSRNDAAWVPGAPPPPRAEVPPVGPLVAAIGHLPETKVVVLTGHHLAASDLAPLARTAVEHLEITPNRELIDDGSAVAGFLPDLKSLALEMAPNAAIPRSALTLAARLPALEQLSLRSPLDPIRGDDLAPLAPLRRLTVLDLNRTPIDESALRVLDEMPHLQVLRLRGAAVSDATLSRIVALHPDLISIEVDGSALTDAGVASLARLPYMTTVILRGTPEAPGHLTDASLVALGRIKPLHQLVVTCGHFGAAGVDALRDLKLVRLVFRSVEAGATNSLALLIRQQRLAWLRLGGPGVTDALLPHLAPNLVPRASLDLTDSAITDAGLSHLASLPLHMLILNRTAITDAGLASLPTTLGPRAIHLRDTKATPAGIAAFERAHPGVRQPGGVLDDD